MDKLPAGRAEHYIPRLQFNHGQNIKDHMHGSAFSHAKLDSYLASNITETFTHFISDMHFNIMIKTVRMHIRS